MIGLWIRWKVALFGAITWPSTHQWGRFATPRPLLHEVSQHTVLCLRRLHCREVCMLALIPFPCIPIYIHTRIRVSKLMRPLKGQAKHNRIALLSYVSTFLPTLPMPASLWQRLTITRAVALLDSIHYETFLHFCVSMMRIQRKDRV